MLLFPFTELHDEISSIIFFNITIALSLCLIRLEQTRIITDQPNSHWAQDIKMGCMVTKVIFDCRQEYWNWNRHIGASDIVEKRLLSFHHSITLKLPLLVQKESIQNERHCRRFITNRYPILFNNRGEFVRLSFSSKTSANKSSSSPFSESRSLSLMLLFSPLFTLTRSLHCHCLT